MSMEREKRQNDSLRIELLDGLRFAAALAVMFYHLAFRHWNAHQAGRIEYPVLGHIAQYGYMGVDFFFMISGFVILMTASRGGVRSFLSSRITRLYPAYWFCVTATFLFLLYWYEGAPQAPTFVAFLVNLSMFQALFGIAHIDGSYWTLTIELGFYGLILVVLQFRQMARIDWILAVWLGAAIATDMYSPLRTLGPWIMAGWCHYFVAGALAYRMRVEPFRWYRLALFSLAYLQAARHAHWYMLLKQRLTGVAYDAWVAQSIVALAFIVFLLLAFHPVSFRHKALRPLGALTYPLYLIHGVIGTLLLSNWIEQQQINAWLALLTVIGGMLIAAWGIHTYIERPLATRLRQMLAPQRTVGERFS